MIKSNGALVNKKRIRPLNSRKPVRGPVVYWMSRDQRVDDNWALIHSIELAEELETSLIVAFALTSGFPGANRRHYAFMLSGLQEVERKLGNRNIPFVLLSGNPPDQIASLTREVKAGAVVSEFDPLRIKKEWKNKLINQIEVPFHEVDAHNIVPCLAASDKQEYGAYTLRPKIKRLLNEFLVEFPELPQTGKRGISKDMLKAAKKASPYIKPVDSTGTLPYSSDWEKVLKKIYSLISNDAGEIGWLKPGEEEAKKVLDDFTGKRLQHYHEKRNDPNAIAVSDLSPYLHFGHISSHRVALEILRNIQGDPSTDAFLEELIVRKELSDNFCHYNAHYESFEGFPQWAKNTLNDHRKDEREFIYTTEEFEGAQTHDQLWNAAQMEMVKNGKMHGYMRMYWAKKILEWTASPEDAISTSIYLNDKYELDGRDPNGYTGCAWSVGGVHDRAWTERPVFGKIRFMNANGCKRKFDTAAYIKKQLSDK